MKKIMMMVMSFVGICVISIASSVQANSTQNQRTDQPFDYVVTEDGREIPIYLYKQEPKMIEAVFELGLISDIEMKEYSQFVKNNEVMLNSEWCPWGGVPAQLISEGWDHDDDYYKDYEHPIGWDHDFICMTAFYYLNVGGNPPQEFHNDYFPGIARHRIKIGLTGFPSWFASQQAFMRWNQ